MELYSYIMSHDTGFAPNPFWGYCTLACCKPVIRRTASVGDWIVGLSGKATENKLIYAMRVDERLTFDEYFRDNWFTAKKPDFSKNCMVYERGDNIYKPQPRGNFDAFKSEFYEILPSKHKEEDMKKDIEHGKYVLISKKFHYFGSKPCDFSKESKVLYDRLKLEGQGQKRISSKNDPNGIIRKKFLEYIGGKREGVIAQPNHEWPDGDDSWKTACV